MAAPVSNGGNADYSIGALSAIFNIKSSKVSKDSFKKTQKCQMKKVNLAFSSLSKRKDETEPDSSSPKKRDKSKSSGDGTGKVSKEVELRKHTRKSLKRKRVFDQDSGNEQVSFKNEPSAVRIKKRKKKKAIEQDAGPNSNIQVRFDNVTPNKKCKKKKSIDDNPESKPSDAQQYYGNVPESLKHEERNESEYDAESNLFNAEDDPEKVARTLFVGNIPLTYKKKKIVKLFKQFGNVESARFRSSLSMAHNNPKKAVFKTRKNLDHSSYLTAYVVMADLESLNKALELNGRELEGHRIRVDLADKKDHDHKKSVFIGNLPYDIEEDELWNFFQECGNVRNVRLIRDSVHKIGKGFGYVLFDNEDGVMLALQKNGQEINGRTIRIFPARSEKQLKKNNFSDKTGSKKWETAGSKRSLKRRNRFRQNHSFEGFGSKPGRDVKKKIIKSIRHPRKRNRTTEHEENSAGLW